MAFFHTERSGGVADASVSRSEEPEFDHRPEDQTILSMNLLVFLRLQNLIFRR
jgi:hypothetical protein